MESNRTKVNVYARVTDDIIKAIEAGAETFEMPWHSKAFAGIPRNPLTKNAYRGINTLVLWVTGRKNGYASSLWATYRQWKQLGAQVREREHGTTILFYKREDESPEHPSLTEERRVRVFMRYSHVFNADQVDGWESQATLHAMDHGTFTAVDRFVDSLGADTRYGSDMAYYSKALDCIFMPKRVEFYDTKAGGAVEAFYATLLHEHVHWSGHPSRLNRDMSGRFGSVSYAMEELVAELGAAFLCASLGISTSPRPDHAGYLADWLKAFKEHKTALVAAASAASTASDYLLSLAAAHPASLPVYPFNPA